MRNIAKLVLRGNRGQETKCCGNDTCKMYSKYSGKCVGNSVVPDNACDKLGCPNNNQKYNDKWWCKNYPGKSRCGGLIDIHNGHTPGRDSSYSKSKSECTGGCVWGILFRRSMWMLFM